MTPPFPVVPPVPSHAYQVRRDPQQLEGLAHASVAYRGFGDEYPENTVAAFREAGEIADTV